MRIKSLIAAILILFLITCNKKSQDQINEAEIHEKAIMDKIDVFTDVFNNKQDISELDSILSDDYVRYLNNIKVASNPKELKASINVFFTGFPDVKLTNTSSIVKDNQVFLHWFFTATNTGIFGETPATGKKVKISGLTHFYFDEHGKMYQEDLFYNELDLLQQLGYVLVSPVTE